jgi:hypothetical protein
MALWQSIIIQNAACREQAASDRGPAPQHRYEHRRPLFESIRGRPAAWPETRPAPKQGEKRQNNSGTGRI